MIRIYSYFTVILLLIVVLPNHCFAKNKSDKIKPDWIKNQPKPLNDTYYFKVIEVDNGKDLNSARTLAQKDLINSIEREFNIKIEEELESQSITNQTDSDTQFSSKEIYSLNIKSEDANVKIYYEKIDEYYQFSKIGENHVFKLYTLYSVARSVENVAFDNFQVTSKYGARGLWRSALVPGLGQFYKGSKTKGGLIVGGTAAMAIGIIITETQRTNYLGKMSQTQNANHMRTYKNKADNMATARNICIGGLAALYVYNLIDAIAAPGAKKVIVRKNKSFKDRIAFAPVFSNEMNGIYLSFKF